VFISMTRPMNLTLTVFLFISLYYLIKKFKLKKQTYSSSFILLFSFIMPLCLSIVFSFSDSAFFNSIIPTRFIHYAYISLFVFSAYIIKPFFLMKKKYICILFILILFFSSTLNMRYTSDYGVNIIQNQGYRWLTDNTELTPNLKEMNYDVKGYYHISHFPLEYYFNTTSSIYGKVTLEKNENTYSPKAQIRFFSYDVIKNLDNIQWTSYNIGIYDDKIYANSKISFYREKGE
ncbi:MAG: hypothetical protein KAQ92_07045, partial [Candidatus Aenigmarchaeota archaeon]|nr:hypothetical protein [Candidatus Aenigmarchaeota archaeon]